MKKKIGIKNKSKKNKDTIFQNLLADKIDPTLPSAKYKIKVTPKISAEIDLNKTTYREFDTIITPAEFEKAIKDSGQPTDKEVDEIRELSVLVCLNNDLLEKIIEKDVISNEDFFKWITFDFPRKSSFNDICKKFAYMYINNLKLVELLELKYKIEDMIKEKVKNKEILG